MAEILIYMSLSLIAAPPGKLINITVLSGAAFVAVNLGVTAKGTRLWYMKISGEKNITKRWAMIPGLF
jgi:3-oxo-5-alpha-steroid 4-dehydrogenase 3 / polyprenol reductase